MHENKINCTIMISGPDLKAVGNYNPADRMKLENRLKRLICGVYVVDEMGRCIIDSDDIPPELKIGEVEPGIRGAAEGEVCVQADIEIFGVEIVIDTCVSF